MKMISVKRERTGRNIPFTDKPEYGPGWVVKRGGRTVAYREVWADAMWAASQFAEQYSAEPLPLFADA